MIYGGEYLFNHRFRRAPVLDFECSPKVWMVRRGHEESLSMRRLFVLSLCKEMDRKCPDWPA